MRTSIHAFVALCFTAMVVGCQTTPKSAEKKEDLAAAAQRQVDAMIAKDPGLRDVIDKAYANAVFPKIGKGGVIVGGAYGRGVVHEQGMMIGYADMTQASVGAQLGGQTYSEIISFENKEALERFKQNKLALSANLSAVIVESGAAKAARYTDGVAVFVMPRAGAMAEASVGGQKFTFVADDSAGAATTRPAP
jgi:lipid-binding SYLF domain-containing protein